MKRRGNRESGLEAFAACRVRLKRSIRRQFGDAVASALQLHADVAGLGGLAGRMLELVAREGKLRKRERHQHQARSRPAHTDAFFVVPV